ADLSKYNGDVDFRALKESGIEFVMLRLGARGYGSGQILLDEKFEEYMNKASEAGLDIGVYFFSQSITAEEAVEESNFIIQTLTERNITYPVAFDMEYVQNDKARVEILSKEEKTAVARAFLENIKAAGYKPMIYGTKEWLIKEINLTKLTEYDIWLSQQKDIPDYPYKFQMWEYTTEGEIAGVDGDVDLNICFVDYAEK
ncbi:MAG: glycoside hydrolase family 25 protein, partial [Kineothrix sp.]|nr:glycoside hydrolase family 25 protein [Kineothrix sp.]